MLLRGATREESSEGEGNDASSVGGKQKLVRFTYNSCDPNLVVVDFGFVAACTEVAGAPASSTVAGAGLKTMCTQLGLRVLFTQCGHPIATWVVNGHPRGGPRFHEPHLHCPSFSVYMKPPKLVDVFFPLPRGRCADAAVEACVS